MLVLRIEKLLNFTLVDWVKREETTIPNIVAIKPL